MESINSSKVTGSRMNSGGVGDKPPSVISLPLTSCSYSNDNLFLRSSTFKKHQITLYLPSPTTSPTQSSTRKTLLPLQSDASRQRHAFEVLFSHFNSASSTIVQEPFPHTIHPLIPRLHALALRHILFHFPDGYRPAESPGNLRQVVNLARHFVVLLALAWPRIQQALERRIHFIAR